MSSISNELKNILDCEQQKIIDSTEKYVLVSACPGSGKTYTIVRKIEEELKNIKEYQGIIACSFTNEASEELKSRINPKLNIENSLICTIDSFIKNIIYMFVNRNLSKMNIWEKKITLGNKVNFPEKIIKINKKNVMLKNGKNLQYNDLVKFFDMYDDLKKIVKLYYKEWLLKLKNNEYEVSFPTYFFAISIVKMEIFQNWFNNKYTSIYIDEAQDLNIFQHKFFRILKENTNVNIIMVGDPLQSIYQFRGARPEMFKSLSEQGYMEYKISVSIRCHPSIMYCANKLFDYNLKKYYDDASHVSIIEDINIDFLNNLEGTVYILTESNKTAIELYELYKNDYDIIYTKKIDIDKEMYSDYYTNSDILDELIKYYLNYDNILDKYKYPFENLEPILLNCNIKIKPYDFNLSKVLNLQDFLFNSCAKLNISISKETIDKIVDILEDEKYKYNYYIVDKKNKIMTIHTSKGLEADNVIIILDNEYDKINDVFKNLLFVAITRAKKNVYIISKNNEKIKNYITKIID